MQTRQTLTAFRARTVTGLSEKRAPDYGYHNYDLEYNTWISQKTKDKEKAVKNNDV